VFHASCDSADTASSHPALPEDAQFGGAAVLRFKLSSATAATLDVVPGFTLVSRLSTISSCAAFDERRDSKRLLFAGVGLTGDRSELQPLLSLSLSLHQISLTPANYGGNGIPPTVVRYTARN